MAKRRMISCDIIDSDAFLDMPQSSQLLYFHLNLRADDDGFINNPKKIMRMVGTQEDDMKILISKKFIIPFESGVVVIKHWKIHNYIAKDRYTETRYKEEKSTLSLDENNAYTDNVNNLYTPCIQNDDTGKVRLGKVSLDKDSKEKKEPAYKRKDTEPMGEFENVYLKSKELEKLILKYGKDNTMLELESLSAYIENKSPKYRNHYATMLSWCRRKHPEIKENKVEDDEDNSEALAYFMAKGDGKEVDIENIDF